jgi:hypothetical protein
MAPPRLLAISLMLAAPAIALIVFIHDAGHHSAADSVCDVERSQNTRSSLNGLLKAMLGAETG